MRSEIPFDKTPAAQLIPWIIAIMVYLVTLVLTVSAGVNDVIHKSQQQLRHTLFVKIPVPSPPENTTAFTPAATVDKHRSVQKSLSDLPDVLSVRLIEASPFLSFLATLDQYRVSSSATKWSFLAVQFKPTADVNALSRMIQAQIPDGHIVETDLDLPQFIKWGWIILMTCLVMGGVMGGLIIGAAMVTIIFTTCTGVALHDEVIHILRLIGATDNYIAKRFRNHAFKISFKGSLIGGILAAFTVAGIIYSIQRYTDVEPWLTQQVIWLTIGLTPLFMMIMILISTRLTVLFVLARRG
jgi:cell division transport system permease protein